MLEFMENNQEVQRQEPQKQAPIIRNTQQQNQANELAEFAII